MSLKSSAWIDESDDVIDHRLLSVGADKMVTGSRIRSAAKFPSNAASRQAAEFQESYKTIEALDTSSYLSLCHFRERVALIDFLRSSKLSQMSFGWEDPAEVQTDSRERAIAFISRIDEKRQLPTVVPDGEGDLMLLWGNPVMLMITLEKKLLHAVIRPASANSKHLPSEQFTGESIPSEIYRHIPLL